MDLQFNYEEMKPKILMCKCQSYSINRMLAKKKKKLNKYKLRDQSLWVGIKRMSTYLCKVFNVILFKKKKKYPNYSSRYLKVTITRVNSLIYFSFGEKKQLSPEGEYFSNSKSFSQEGTNIMLNLKKSINRSTLFYSYKAFVKSTHFNKREAMKSGL